MTVFFKICYHYVYFNWSLKKDGFKNNLNKCNQPGFLAEQKDIDLADRILRRMISFLKPQSGCLLHSLVLLRASRIPAELLLDFKEADSFESHAFVRILNKEYSTALVDDTKKALLLWSKPC